MHTEAETRKKLIDTRLAEAGWNIADRSQVVEEFEIITSMRGNQYADYVLLGKNGKPVAVVEAKKTSVDAALGREQAKQYCENIALSYSIEIPFCFYTNGHEIYFWDIGQYPPRKVYGFPTREDLERFQYVRDNRKPLAEELINTRIAGRDYQIKAIRAVLEGIAKQRRSFLLVMATGTGKTRTCIALVDALMRAGYAEKVLFLVDRIALREQALDAFKDHLPNEPRWPREEERGFAKDRRVYVTTYPSMLNIIRNKEVELSPHFFDLIVVDESHRSIYNTYGEVLNYFNAIAVGLTATPTDVIDHNTFELFHCDNELPTFAYTYEEAVNNIPPYLCNFQVMKIHTRFQDEGINKRTISLEDQKRLMLEGREVEDINFEGTELEKTVTNRGTNTLIIREFMEESIKDANGVLPGKTIFFCASKEHARRMEQIFDALYPEYKGELAKVLVSEDPRVHGKGGLLDQFKKQDMPRIALSVDMLDTGIDVREIVNLVFAKPVYSYTKFWQMIGRGTRLLEANELKPWCTKKDVFLIIDCWDNFEYFKLNPKGKELPAQVPLPVRFAAVRIDLVEKALDHARQDILEIEVQRLRAQINELPEKSVTVQDAASDVARAQRDDFWQHLTHEKLNFLRERIKPLFRAMSQVDFKAMRFQKDVLETALAHLGGEKDKYETMRDDITEQVAELPLSVNIVAKEKELIETVLSATFWDKATHADLVKMADRLAAFMRFREGDRPPTGMAQLDLKDYTTTKEFVEFGPEHSTVSVSEYRKMVERLVLELTESNAMLRKLRDGKTLSEAETSALADELYREHPHITEELLQTVYQNRKAKFIQFIRHILGLEVLPTFAESVQAAFDVFLAEHTNLGSLQLEFLRLLKDFILNKEKIEKRDLIEAPFTVLHPQGIRGLFSPAEIEEILQLAKKVAA